MFMIENEMEENWMGQPELEKTIDLNLFFF